MHSATVRFDLVGVGGVAGVDRAERSAAAVTAAAVAAGKVHGLARGQGGQRLGRVRRWRRRHGRAGDGVGRPERLASGSWLHLRCGVLARTGPGDGGGR